MLGILWFSVTVWELSLKNICPIIVFGGRERASAAIPSYLCIRNVKNAKSPYPTLVAPTFGYLLRASTKSQKIVGLICRLKDHCSLSKICSCCLSVFHLPRPTTRLNRQSYSQPFPLPSSAAPAMFKVVFKATMCCLVACPSRPFLLPSSLGPCLYDFCKTYGFK